ncbi:MAG: endo-1,3-alpha-glucanase family glycosylhydrolase [Spirochaetota bacterium]
MKCALIALIAVHAILASLTADDSVVFDDFETGVWKEHAKRTSFAKEGSYAMDCGGVRKGKPWLVAKDLDRFDASGYKAITFWLYNEADRGKKIFITISSIPDTEYEKARADNKFDSGNYFLASIDLNFNGWQKTVIPFNRFAKIRSPKGWNALDNIQISMDTREPSTNESTSIIIDDMHFIRRTVQTAATAKNILSPSDARKPVFGWFMRSFLLDYDYSGLRDRPVWASTGDQVKDLTIMINAAKKGGLDGFAIQSNPRKVYFDSTLALWRNMLLAARPLDLKILFELEMYYSSKQEVIDWIIMTHREFGKHPSVYRVNGKPVYLLWLRTSQVKFPFNVSRGEGSFPAEDWKDIVETVRRETGNDIYLFANMFESSKVGGTGYTDYEKEELMPLWDGLWEFGGLHNLIMVSDKPWSVVHDAMEKYKSEADAFGMTYIAGLIPGFWREEAGWFVDPKGTAYYREAWEKMIALSPFGVMIQSWNDYSEDAQIGPGARTGNCLLELSRYYIEKYKGVPVTQYPSPRIWVSQPTEVMRGDIIYTEFLDLPYREALKLAGSWQDESGKTISTFEQNLSPGEMHALTAELPYAHYKNARAVRITAALTGARIKQTVNTRWTWINPVARFDRFTMRYLFDDQISSSSASLSGSPRAFSATVTGGGKAAVTLMRRNAANKGETPTRMEMPLALPAAGAAPSYECMIRYFECDRPEYECSLALRNGTIVSAEAIGSRISNLTADASSVRWISRAFGRAGLGVNAGFDGIRCTLTSVDTTLMIRIGALSQELSINDLISSGSRTFALGRDGFVLIELSPARSAAQDMTLPLSRNFTIPAAGKKPADAYWLDVKTAAGNTAQSSPVFPPVGITFPTWYYDEKEGKAVPGEIPCDDALIGSWGFDERGGGLVLDTSAYGHYGKFGGVSVTGFGAGVGGSDQSPARGELEGRPALIFDGAKKQFVALPFGVLPQGCFTIGFTMRSKPQIASQTILLLGWQLSLKYGPDGRLTAAVGTNNCKSAEPLPEGLCSVQVVYDLRSLEIYIDKKLSARIDMQGRLPRLSGGLIIGCGYGNPGPSAEPFTGAISALSIHAAPLRP